MTRTGGIRAGITEMLRITAGGLVDATMPQTCASCGAWISGGGKPVCESCHDELTASLPRPWCPRCGRTLPSTAIHERDCARCRNERYWNLAGIARVGLYPPALRRLVLGLKYGGRERNADVLADLLATAIRTCEWAAEVDALVPVPMHRLRRWQRPCDHARVLADALGRRLGLPVWRPLRRTRYRPSQTGLSSRMARFENVKGCFAPALWQRRGIAGSRVCIIDNLVLSGATVHEVSKVLRRMGAKRIYAAVLARPAAPGEAPSQEPIHGVEQAE